MQAKSAMPIAFCLVLGGHVAAQAPAGLPILGASSEYVITLDVSTFVENTTLRNIQSRPDACGDTDHFIVEPPARFTFTETSPAGQPSTECGELGLRYAPPDGVRQLRVDFLANRSVKAPVDQRDPITNRPARLDTRAFQELRVADDEGILFLTIPLFPGSARDSEFMGFSHLIEIPTGSATVNLTWYFEDRGPVSASADAPSVLSSDFFIAAVDSPRIRLTDVRTDFGSIRSTTSREEAEHVVTTTFYSVEATHLDGAGAPSAIRIRLANDANLSHVLAPDGATLDVAGLTRTIAPDATTLELPESVLAAHGAGSYLVAIVTRAPAPAPTADASPLDLLPFAILAIALPVVPAAWALVTTGVFARRAVGRFRAPSRALLGLAIAFSLAYAVLLLYTLGAGRIVVLRQLAPPSEAMLLLALFLMLAVTLLTVAVVPARYALRGMKADLEQRQRAETKFRGLLEGAPDPMVIIDQTGKIVLANAQAEKAFGRARADLVGRPANDLLPERLRGADPISGASFFLDPRHREPGSRSELYGVRSDGTEFPVEISLAPIQSREGLLVTAAIRDVTEQRRARQALERSNEELEQFAYVASHDLQEPLRTVSGFAQLLEQRYGPSLDEKGRDYVRRTVAGSRRMQQLINDLLAFSRISNTHRPMGRVALDEVFATVLADLQGFIESEQADVRADPLPAVRGDAGQLAQVFSNLIRNAVRNRHPDRRAVVRVSAAPEGPAWRVSVRDNGIGIEAQYHARIFLIFQRLTPRTEHDQGTGLGLAITKKIVERHDGRIWLESTPGEGSTFHFTVPRIGGEE